MKEKLLDAVFIALNLLTVILLFTILDHAVHVLESAWKVPDYYFRNKIPFGFLWGVAGIFLAERTRGVWFKALLFSGLVAVALQVRYFLEGYPVSFVLLFLLFHFIILYCLSLGMFFLFKSEKYAPAADNTSPMKKIGVVLIVLVVGFVTYYLVFSPGTSIAPDYSPKPLPTVPSTTAESQVQTAAPTPTPAASNVTVHIKNFAFNPSALSVKTGTKVTWVNDDNAPHTVTSDSGNLLDSVTLATGQSFSYTFTDSGNISYHCGVHKNMRGVVAVGN